MTESVSFNEPEALLDDYQHLESKEADSLNEYTDSLRSQHRELERDIVKYWASNGDDEQLEHTMARRN